MRTLEHMLQRIRKDTIDSPTLGYNVGRITDFVYHLEHERGENSWFNNPHMVYNMQEWEKFSQWTKNNF